MHAQRRVIVVALCVGRLVSRCICPHVFSRTVAVANVDMCYRRLAQQESGAVLSKNSMFRGEAKCIQCVDFSRKLRVVDTKRGYVGRYEERFTQQVSGVALSVVCMLPGSLVPRLRGGRSGVYCVCMHENYPKKW